MVYVRKTKKTYTKKPKRVVKRLARKAYSNPNRSLVLSGFPNSKVVKMRYVESIGVDPVQFSAGSYIFRANSIFDPNYTGVGHQPMGHDEWATIYNHYSVLGSKAKVTFMSTDNTFTNSGCVCTVSRQADFSTLAISSGTRIQESGAKYKLLGIPNSGQGRITLYSSFSAKKHLRSSTNQTLNRAAFGSNPTEEQFFHCTFSPIDASQNLGVVYMYVEIDYIVLLSEKKTLSQS